MKQNKHIVISKETHIKLSLEMVKQGRTRKAIVDDAIKMYLEFKESERLLNKDRR